MLSLARFLPLLPLLVLGLALPGARASWTEANTACPTRATGGRSRLLSFLWLRPDGVPPVLVQSLWDKRSGRLLECAWRTEPALTRRYLELCVPGRAAADAEEPRGSLVRASWGPELHRELRALEKRKGECKGAPGAAKRVKQAPAGGPETEPPRRSRTRRGWTMPGTLWCGAGNSADDPSELGVFQGPDVCCREHDRCDAQISALGFKYGIRNYRLHTISHCSCDNRFRDCLKSLNDTISNFIGISFFDLLEVPCFNLKESEECLEWHWWGGCSKYGPMPMAFLVEPHPYFPHTTPPPPRPGRRRGQHRNTKGAKKRPSGAPASIAPFAPISEPDQIMHIPVQETESGSPATSEPDLLRTDAGALTAQRPVSPPTEAPLSNETWHREEPFSRTVEHGHAAEPRPALSQRCRCYRRLDQCPFKIAPGELKYQLHNSDDRTLFHCSCTHRLARFLRRKKGPNEVEEEVLSHYISPFCFVLETPPGCTEGEESSPNCIGIGKAVLAPAHHLTNRLAHRRAGAFSKVKRQDRAPALGEGVQLFDQCMRLVRDARPAVPR